MFAISDNFKRLYPFVAFVTVPDQLNARSGINKKSPIPICQYFELP